MNTDRFLCRAKRIDDGEWVIGNYCEISPPPQAFGDLPPSQKYMFCENPNTISDWGMPRQMCLIDIDSETVGQCTGLKDKTGRLIFEGDILHHKWDSGYDGWIETISEVKWSKGNFIVDDKKRADFLLSLHSMYGNIEKAWAQVEIIGNIHDKPELLKGGAE